MKKSLIASKILPLLSILMCIFLGCRKDKDEPDPNNSTSCKIESFNGVFIVYDQFGRLKTDGRNYYTYDNEGYLITTEFNPNEENSKEVTTHKYENGLLVKTSRISGSNRNFTVQDFQYDNSKKLISITRNVYPLNSLTPSSTYDYTFKDEKIASYIETVRGKTATPHEFKDGRLIKSIIEGGYQEYEYDNLGRVIKRTTLDKGKLSSVKISYQDGKSYHTTFPNLKGFPDVINNWRQGSFYTVIPEVNEIFDLYYLLKETSTFTVEDGKDIEQRRYTFLYKLNKEGFPVSLETHFFLRDSKGVLTDAPHFSYENYTFTYTNCE
jgi:YD repeat-containing protein